MNLKVLFFIFLCLSSTSIIYNVAMVTLNSAEGWNCKTSRRVVRADYILTNGTEPEGGGDPIGGGDWPY